MGDASIIARLLANGHVQYGWSGNGGYFSMVGIRLLLWYQEPKNVEYLFSLGQTSLIGKIGSEKGGSLGSCCQSDQKDFSEYTVTPSGYRYNFYKIH